MASMNEEMNFTRRKIKQMIRSGESQILDFKQSEILSNNFKLSREMSAFANQEGGVILIGVKDDKSIERFKKKSAHESKIINISNDLIRPPLRISFSSVDMGKRRFIYVIRIPKRKNIIHGVKSDSGYVYFIRSGQHVKEITPEELSVTEVKNGKIIGFRTNPLEPIESFLITIGRKFLLKAYGKLNPKLERTLSLIRAAGYFLIVLPFLIFMVVGSMTGNVSNFISTFSSYFIGTILGGVFSGLFLLYVTKLARQTRCPECIRYFSFIREIKEIIDKGKYHNFYRCIECNYKSDILEADESDI